MHGPGSGSLTYGRRSAAAHRPSQPQCSSATAGGVAGLPGGRLQRLWSALRLAWLFATWVVHRGAAGPRCSSTVVAYAVGYLQQRICAAFALCAVQRYVYDRLPARVAAVCLHQPPFAAFTVLTERLPRASKRF